MNEPIAEVETEDGASPESEATRERIGGETEQARWIRLVIDGLSMVEAVAKGRAGSRATRLRLVAGYLGDPLVRNELIQGLCLTGQEGRAEEILRYYAALAAGEAIEKGDSRVILAMLPKGSGRAKKASEEVPELPSGGRSLK